MTAERELTIAIEDPSRPEIIALSRDGEDPFGDYRADPLSVFMEKELSDRP
jgi:hypothetical protein